MELDFGGQIRPIPTRLRSDAFETMLRRLAVNAEPVFSAEADAGRQGGGSGANEVLHEDVLSDVTDGGQADCNYLIVCPESLVGAANALADWKRMKGLRTTVVTTATAGTDKTSIQNYVKSVSPEYLLLLGDAEFIPCFYVIPHAADLVKQDNKMEGKVASDRYYALLDNDNLPDLYVGHPGGYHV